MVKGKSNNTGYPAERARGAPGSAFCTGENLLRFDVEGKNLANEEKPVIIRHG